MASMKKTKKNDHDADDKMKKAKKKLAKRPTGDDKFAGSKPADMGKKTKKKATFMMPSAKSNKAAGAMGMLKRGMAGKKC